MAPSLVPPSSPRRATPVRPVGDPVGGPAGVIGVLAAPTDRPGTTGTPPAAAGRDPSRTVAPGDDAA